MHAVVRKKASRRTGHRPLLARYRGQTETGGQRMGFMDKAKKLAEQAQEKLDEAQKNFNKSDSPQGQTGESVQYDEHGRPIQQETPAAATPPPPAEPPAADAPAAEPPAADPATEEQPPAAPPAGDTNASPDPFKPIQ
jgi:hypothetical protein